MTELSEALGGSGLQLAGRMPTEWEASLADLEGQLVDPARWPKDATQAQHYFETASDLVRELPARAELGYLPRLSTVRWGATAFQALRRGRGETLEQLEAAAQNVSELLQTVPDGVPPEICERLREQAQEEERAALRMARDEDVEGARRVLAERADHEDLLTAYELLKQHAQDPEVAETVEPLLTELRERILTQESRAHAARLQDQWGAVQKLKSRPLLYERAVGTLLAEVMSMRVVFAVDGIVEPALERLDGELRRATAALQAEAAAREEARQAQAVRAYQRWALEQIKSFEEEFERARRKARENSAVYGESWNEPEYKSVRDSMVAHLLSINVALLDLPVQERYQRAFQLGWKQLEGHAGQTFVAERSALAVKKSLRDFMEPKQ